MNKKLFEGNFIIPEEKIRMKLDSIKAFLFDWDGVFNNGNKSVDGSSTFSEVDAMGTNLLRFNQFLQNGTAPFTALVSGEKNITAIAFAQRENFNSVYYRVKHKVDALNHCCKEWKIEPSQVAFFFDDVLDLSAAAQVGLRIMIGRGANPCFNKYVRENELAEYSTYYSGGENGLREAVELLINLSGMYDETIEHRMLYSDTYIHYLQQRNSVNPVFYTSEDFQIISQQP